MFVNIGHVKQNTTYRFTDKGVTNDVWYHNNDKVLPYTLNSQKGHLGFTKRPDSEYVKLSYYRKNLIKDACEECGNNECRLEVHHVNGDHSDCGENYSNLKTLCVSCHKKAHYAMGRVKMGERGLNTALKKVKSVEYIDKTMYMMLKWKRHIILSQQWEG